MHAIQPPASALKQAVPPKVYIVSRIILPGSLFYIILPPFIVDNFTLAWYYIYIVFRKIRLS